MLFLSSFFHTQKPPLSPYPRHHCSVHVSPFGVGTLMVSGYTSVTWAKRIIDNSSISCLPSVPGTAGVTANLQFLHFTSASMMRLSKFLSLGFIPMVTKLHSLLVSTCFCIGLSLSLPCLSRRQWSASPSHSTLCPELHDQLHHLRGTLQSLGHPPEIKINISRDNLGL